MHLNNKQRVVFVPRKAYITYHGSYLKLMLPCLRDYQTFLSVTAPKSIDDSCGVPSCSQWPSEGSHSARNTAVFSIAHISSAIHHKPISVREMSTLGYHYQNILEPPVFGVDINMIMAKQNLAPLKTGIMYDDV